MIGKTLGHYEITEKLGEGGMGAVYKARDARLDRFVALKVLPAEMVADPDRKRRFAQEARSASALNHPSIVTIYDIGSADGVDFIAMEHVAGRTLAASIDRKGMPLAEVLKCAVQIGDALSAAHAAGLVHRDLKPANVMVTDKGLVKVLDFGLAKLTEPAPVDESAVTETARPLTQLGVIVGTVAYMSPEQAEGKKVDARSDIFSFGTLRTARASSSTGCASVTRSRAPGGSRPSPGARPRRSRECPPGRGGSHAMRSRGTASTSTTWKGSRSAARPCTACASRHGRGGSPGRPRGSPRWLECPRPRPRPPGAGWSSPRRRGSPTSGRPAGRRGRG